MVFIHAIVILLVYFIERKNGMGFTDVMSCTTIQTVIVNTQSICFTDMRYKTDFYFKLHSPYIAIWTHHRVKKCRGSF